MNINKDTALWRGIRTALQALAGLFVGLVVAVWSVDGVPDAVYAYVTANVPNFLVTLGLPSVLSGFFGFLWNAARKDVPTT